MNRNQLRQTLMAAWQKYQSKAILSPLEAEIVEVITEHPEYHSELIPTALSKDFIPEAGQTNPFLHISLHLGLREQLKTNRPLGILPIFTRLCAKLGTHTAEHQMIEVLAETLWEAQREGTLPNEALYLERLELLQNRFL